MADGQEETLLLGARARARSLTGALAPRREGATDNSFSGSRKCRPRKIGRTRRGLNWSRDSRNRIATATSAAAAAAFATATLQRGAVGSRNPIITARLDFSVVFQDLAAERFVPSNRYALISAEARVEVKNRIFRILVCLREILRAVAAAVGLPARVCAR